MKLRFLSLIFIALSLLNAGCGYTLRESAELPLALKTMQLETRDGNSEMARALRRSLTNSGVTLIDETKDGVFILGLGREQDSEKVLSLNSNARAGEYELRMRISFQLVSSEEDFIIPPEILSLRKVYLADPNNAVAKQEEAELIKEEMRTELANQVLRRLESLDPGMLGSATATHLSIRRAGSL